MKCIISLMQSVRKTESERSVGQPSPGSPRARARGQQSPARTGATAHRSGSERLPGKSGHAALVGTESADWANWDSFEAQPAPSLIESSSGRHLDQFFFEISSRSTYS